MDVPPPPVDVSPPSEDNGVRPPTPRDHRWMSPPSDSPYGSCLWRCNTVYPWPRLRRAAHLIPGERAEEQRAHLLTTVMHSLTSRAHLRYLSANAKTLSLLLADTLIKHRQPPKTPACDLASVSVSCFAPILC